MLIDSDVLMRELDKELDSLMKDTFQTPPPDYAGFMKAVGRYAHIVEMKTRVQALARRRDE